MHSFQKGCSSYPNSPSTSPTLTHFSPGSLAFLLFTRYGRCTFSQQFLRSALCFPCYLCGSLNSLLSEVLPFLYLKNKKALTLAACQTALMMQKQWQVKLLHLKPKQSSSDVYSCRPILQRHTLIPKKKNTSHVTMSWWSTDFIKSQPWRCTFLYSMWQNGN